MKTAIIGCGFLGGYTAASLLKNRDNKVIAVDKKTRNSVFNFPLLKEFKDSDRFDYRWQSVGDAISLVKDLKEVDNIVFTSAIADVPYAMKSVGDTFYTNVQNTVSFFEVLRHIDFDGTVVMMSSESVLGHHPEEELPLTETTLPEPANVYGCSKLCQEQIAKTYYHSYGIKSVILRSATMFGPYGRLDQAMPIFISQALQNKPITVHGDGSNSRDFNYVTNTVDGIELALKKGKEVAGEVFNIGSGEETHFGNLIRAIKMYTGSTSEISFGEWRAGEKGLRVALNINKAKEKLGYKPNMGLLEGIADVAIWIAQDILQWEPKEVNDLSVRMGKIPESVTTVTGLG